jgi:hypothetical protein
MSVLPSHMAAGAAGATGTEGNGPMNRHLPGKSPKLPVVSSERYVRALGMNESCRQFGLPKIRLRVYN